MSLGKLSIGAKILLAGGVLLLIDSFFSWNEFAGVFHASGWNGVGVLMGLLVFALIAWEVLLLLNVGVDALPLKAELISAGLAALAVVFTVIRFLVKPSIAGEVSLNRAWPAWVGLILAGVLAIGAFFRFKEGGGEIPKKSA